MSANKRLLFVCNNRGFFISHRLPIALAAQEAGFDVHLLADAPGSCEVLKRHHIHYHPFTVSRKGKNPIREFGVLLRLFFKIKHIQPDILHLITPKMLIYGGIIGRLLRVPAIISAVSGMGVFFSYDRKSSWLVKTMMLQLFKLSVRKVKQRVIFQNAHQRDFFINHSVVAAKSACLIRGSGVDLDQFNLTPKGNDVPTIMLASRLIWGKGIANFVNSAKTLNQQGQKAKFVLVGQLDPGAQDGIDKQTIAAWQAQGLIEWWGGCAQDELPQQFARADIFCLPTYCAEGLPKVLLEACACRLPVVTTDIPGCNDVVLDGHNGLLVRIKDPVALTCALQKLIDNRALCRSMGEKGRVRMEHYFGEETVVKQTLDLYESVGITRKTITC